MKEAAAEGADILLLPEAFITGYELPMSNEEAFPEDSPFWEEICNRAAQLQIGVVATAITRGPQKPQNSAFVVDKSGAVLMKYSKVHTFDFAGEACLESGMDFMCAIFMGSSPNGQNAGSSCAFSPICWDKIRSYREREMLGNTFRKVKAYGPLQSSEVQYPFIR